MLLCAAAVLISACGGGNPAPSSGEPRPGETPSPFPSPIPSAAPSPGSASCLAPAEAAQGGELELEPWIEGAFERPVAMVQPPGEDSVWYVVEQRGTIRRVEQQERGTTMSLALDWRGVVVDPVVTDSAETGLLGLAFHPRFPEDNRAFVYATLAATAPGECPTVVVAELLHRSGKFEPVANATLLSVERICRFLPEGRFEAGHNAGTMHFDPTDGWLVVGIGDLSQRERSQDPDTVEGTLLRLDVDAPRSGEEPLPGVHVPAEVVAYGFRNPWKWSFDRATGEIWLGDVGWSSREEIDRVERGGNYGWPVWEGELCNTAKASCADADHMAPTHTYHHGTGCSVTGGYVYRGDRLPELEGVYVFADWCAGLVWGLFPTNDGFEAGLLADYAGPISSFAEGNDGELYVLDFWGGSVLRLSAFQRADRPGFPSRLSETGCVEPDDTAAAAEGLVAYEINVPFWSDGATKRRWMSVPRGEAIQVADDGRFVFPPGTVLMKEFARGGRVVETRLLMNHAASGWTGYSYAWDGEDALLVSPFGETRSVTDGRDWVFPAREECSRCHTERAGWPLGLEVGQLDRLVDDGRGGAENQLDILVSTGLLDAASLSRSTAPRLAPASEEPRTDEEVHAAARAYLHVNCAPCHRPGSRTYFPEMDLRASIALEDAAVCHADPTRISPAEDLSLIVPGDPERSLLLTRLQHEGDLRMPPLGSLEIDRAGARLVTEWILSLDDRCLQ